MAARRWMWTGGGLLVAGVALGMSWMAAGAAAAAPKLTEREQVVQALNRLTWGIAPGDVELVERVGLKSWIDQQLHPDRVVENPLLEDQLQPLLTLQMSNQQIIENYPPQQAIQQMAEGKRPLPTDPKVRAEAEREIAAYKAKLDAKDDTANGGAADPKAVKAGQVLAAAQQDAPVDETAPPLASLLTPEQLQGLRQGSPQQKVAALEALPDELREKVFGSLGRGQAQQLSVWLPMAQQRELAVKLTPQQVVSNDLTSARILRAVESNRQLEDVLTDFWFNHFNIFINKGEDHFMITAYERDSIRPHVLGKFRDLLLATAEDPAMQFYLDNWQSVGPNPAAGRRGGAAPAAGLNENYGREIMELHTLGVSGGYTQKDVTEVARCFTGWSIQQPLMHATFIYNDRQHDHGEKVVLGVTIPAGGGMSDGLKVIDILASSPATAHHISYELAQRFVADEPPPALVDRMAATFSKSGGDLRAVMATIIGSPEFYDPAYFRDKVKSPLEMVVGSVRALGATVDNPTRLVQTVAQMGEPLYGKEPPTGYPNTGDAWVSSSGLIARLNFGLQLASNQIPGVHADLSPFAAGETDRDEVIDSLCQHLLQGPMSPSTRATIVRALSGGATGAAVTPVMADGNPHPLSPAEMQRVAGLVLGSPEFQHR